MGCAWSRNHGVATVRWCQCKALRQLSRQTAYVYIYIRVCMCMCVYVDEGLNHGPHTVVTLKSGATCLVRPFFPCKAIAQVE